jgi:TRAP-type C4-dicarboxylate transport system permease small subunit
MDRLLNIANAVSRAGAWFSGALLLLAATIIGIDVAIRKLFSLSIGGADELAGFSLAIATAWGLSFALVQRAHIRIDTLYMMLPARIAALLDLLGLGAFLAFIGLVAWHASGVLKQSIVSNTHSVSALETPLMLPQFLWVAGFVVFLLVGTLLLLRAAFALATGDVGGALRLIGSRSAKEEVEQEIADVTATRTDDKP